MIRLVRPTPTFARVVDCSMAASSFFVSLIRDSGVFALNEAPFTNSGEGVPSGRQRNNARNSRYVLTGMYSLALSVSKHASSALYSTGPKPGTLWCWIRTRSYLRLVLVMRKLLSGYIQQRPHSETVTIRNGLSGAQPPTSVAAATEWPEWRCQNARMHGRSVPPDA